MFSPDGKNVFNSVSQINYNILSMFVAKKGCSSSRTAGRVIFSVSVDWILGSNWADSYH